MFCRKCQVWIQKLSFSIRFSQAVIVKSSSSCRTQNSLSNSVSLRKYYSKSVRAQDQKSNLLDNLEKVRKGMWKLYCQ